jgi:sialate O-acetylesterase
VEINMKMKHTASFAAILLALTWAWPSGGQMAGGSGDRGSGAQETQGPGTRGGPLGGGQGMQGMPQLTREQQASIRAMNQASAPLDRAVTEARNALDASIFTGRPDMADIQVKADKLAAAELSRALARAEAFGKLQASPNKLNLPAQSLMMLMNMGGRGGPGGFGGPGFPPGGPGGPDGNKPPPVEGGFETSFVCPIFGDNMVLQRGKPNTIWGWAKPGKEIRITIADNRVNTVTKDDGRWSVAIQPPAPGGPYTVVIDGPQHVEFHEVLVGDVWLCGGQSNMEMGLGAARNGSEEVKAANHPKIRLFIVKQQTARKPATVPQGSWKICSPQNVGEGWSGFSAVAYFFGRRLQQEVNVPLGLVEDCGGGTPAEAWTRAETLRSLGISDTGSGPNTPVVLYNGMIAPVAPLAISGAIWYQGESNTERATQYRKLLPAMIADWRNAFSQGDLPFYIVSLAAHKQHMDTPGDDSWAELRAAQDFVANTVTNSGLAVAIDVGDARDVHPKDKKEVGERLALVALARHYGKDIPYSGPRLASVEKLPGALKLWFTHTNGGLVVKGEKLEEFSICSEDCKWYWADARIAGDGVVVSSSEVPNPVAACYAWQANPKATLFNGAGLPAIPFRTDDVGGTNDNKKLAGKQ